MNQRRNYKLYQEGKPSATTEEPIRELESIGFVWATSKSGWSARFQQLRGRIRSLPCAKQISRQPQARKVGYESAQQLQVVSGRKAKSHVSGPHSRARECWIQMGGEKDCFGIQNKRD
jgi:hypothetical protein